MAGMVTDSKSVLVFLKKQKNRKTLITHLKQKERCSCEACARKDTVVSDKRNNAENALLF